MGGERADVQGKDRQGAGPAVSSDWLVVEETVLSAFSFWNLCQCGIMWYHPLSEVSLTSTVHARDVHLQCPRDPIKL